MPGRSRCYVSGAIIACFTSCFRQTFPSSNYVSWIRRTRNWVLVTTAQARQNSALKALKLLHWATAVTGGYRARFQAPVTNSLRPVSLTGTSFRPLHIRFHPPFGSAGFT
ncbi:hypothetical protein K449DRAFT_440610 [Hypoxylon sp. EC38]|nr:hypothetical protein K449DRAFT_440610 [Hypoxylon sp. EC38]